MIAFHAVSHDRQKAICSFVLSQSTSVKDGQTDRITTPTAQDRASIAASSGKNEQDVVFDSPGIYLVATVDININ